MLLSRVRASLWCGLLTVLLVCGVPLGLVQAQEEKAKPKSDPPFLVVNVASVERLLSNIDYMFASVDRPELSEIVTGALSNVRDLKGLPRDKSFGMMLFLNGLVPEPIGYLPVDDLEEFIKTAQIGPVTTKKISDDRFELVGPVQSLQAKVANGYAYIGRNEDALNRKFDDPAKFAQKLTQSYDIGATLNIKAIPKTSRDFFLDFLRASMEAQAQQRDDEPDAAYRMRHAAEMSNFSGMEMLFTQAEEITLGWTVSPQERSTFLEAVIIASPKTDYAKLLNQLGSTRSRFASLLQNPTPASFSIASIFDPPSRKMFSEMLQVLEEETLKGLNKSSSEGTDIPGLYQSLRATVEDGKMDVCVQLLGEPPGPFSIVGGIRLSETDKFQRGLTEILGKLKSRPELESLDLNITEHRGVQFHRIQGKGAEDEGAIRFFGKEAAVFVGAGDGIVWFSVGGEDALPALKDQMDAVAEGESREAPAPPMAFAFHLASFLWLADNDGDQTAAQVFRDAFAKGDDAIRMEMKPLQDGARVRITLEEGFVRLVGKALALLNDSRRN